MDYRLLPDGCGSHSGRRRRHTICGSSSSSSSSGASRVTLRSLWSSLAPLPLTPTGRCPGSARSGSACRRADLRAYRRGCGCSCSCWVLVNALTRSFHCSVPGCISHTCAVGEGGSTTVCRGCRGRGLRWWLQDFVDELDGVVDGGLVVC